MLLGSGELGKEVLIALQRLGVETIAVDRYADAPGQQVAHHARTITMSDPVALRALSQAASPHSYDVSPMTDAVFGGTSVYRAIGSALRTQSPDCVRSSNL